MLRKFITAAVAAAAMALAVGGAASAAPTTHHDARARGHIVWAIYPHSGTTRWTYNPNDQLQKAHIKCVSRGSYHDYNGGWEEGTLSDDKSVAVCPPGWNPDRFGYYWKDNGGPEHLVWAWPS